MQMLEKGTEAHHFWIVKTNLTNIHRSSFLQIGPGSVNNIDIIHLVACHIIQKK